MLSSTFFFFNDTATTEIYTLSLHDALPISRTNFWRRDAEGGRKSFLSFKFDPSKVDRKSTRLNSSHSQISYAVFCLKKKKSIVILVPHVTLLYVVTLSILRLQTLTTIQLLR